MAVSRDDVRHIAALARIGVPDERLDALVRELNGILAHMDALQRVESAGVLDATVAAQAGMPLRADAPPCVALERPREQFAPVMRGRDGAPVPAMMDGFYLVPRLATHEDAGGEA
jgi:aspartyl-tRNA(Asn)/glutamyl-tRNA(Gln) amidotransferase subunit C